MLKWRDAAVYDIIIEDWKVESITKRRGEDEDPDFILFDFLSSPFKILFSPPNWKGWQWPRLQMLNFV